MESERNLGSRYELQGEVVCNDVTNTRAVHRFAQKWIGQWIAEHRPTAPRAACRFNVIFNREGAGHTIGCRVVVLVDGELWRGGHYGDTLTEALKQSLGHMKAATQKFRPTTQG